MALMSQVSQPVTVPGFLWAIQNLKTVILSGTLL